MNTCWRFSRSAGFCVKKRKNDSVPTLRKNGGWCCGMEMRDLASVATGYTAEVAGR